MKGCTMCKLDYIDRHIYIYKADHMTWPNVPKKKKK